MNIDRRYKTFSLETSKRFSVLTEGWSEHQLNRWGNLLWYSLSRPDALYHAAILARVVSLFHVKFIEIPDENILIRIQVYVDLLKSIDINKVGIDMVERIIDLIIVPAIDISLSK